MSTDKILVPFNRPDIDEADIARVVATLRSGWITTGPAVREFESGLRAYLGVSHVICLNSATAAMEMALLALGIGPGDEVVTTVYTYAATANIVRHTGARLVLVDIGAEGFAIDPAAVEAAVNARTKAVISVDFAGIPCNYRALRTAIDSHKREFVASNEFQASIGGAAILADAAHALGASFSGKRVPEWADMAAYSFHAVKNLTTAEGGALAFADLGRGGGNHFGEQSSGPVSEGFERRVRLLALHGQSKDALAKMAAGSWEYDIEVSGYKHNMTDIQAALGIGQLARYGARLER
ncbi:MAG TPA: DegT/DnrJ/EryC1/StrS aminotransferase family protein, partial [Spirochaetota bacterium]|nr:DegT/DnrJ/EryC1/StrS aminotransferase family protein [Spirochaetota bacterium]